MSPPLHKAEMVTGKVTYMVSKFGMTYLVIALKEELGEVRPPAQLELGEPPEDTDEDGKDYPLWMREAERIVAE